jgi:hypothetical protein
LKTVFIIGAGASKEINMPIGDKLKRNISSELNIHIDNSGPLPDLRYDVHRAIRIYGEEMKGKGITQRDIFLCTVAISKALPLSISIDNYLDAHRDNKMIETIGKIGIINSILMAEHNSKLFGEKKEGINFNALEETWYTSLFKKLTEGCQFNQLSKRLKNVSFIIFNYDRSFEYFLYNALIIYYSIEKDKAAEAVNGINIYHPYGIAGTLPFQNNDINVDYGNIPSPEQLYLLSKQIKTFMEGVDSSLVSYQKLTTELINAQKIIFLGFAYHKQNIDLLFPKKIDGEIKIHSDGIARTPEWQSCYGTFLGISKDNQKKIIYNLKDLDGRIGNEINAFEGTCYDFFNEYGHSLIFD